MDDLQSKRDKVAEAIQSLAESETDEAEAAKLFKAAEMIRSGNYDFRPLGGEA